MSHRNDLSKQEALTMSLIKFYNTFSHFCSNVKKFSTIFVNACSILPIIDEFVRQG